MGEREALCLKNSSGGSEDAVARWWSAKRAGGTWCGACHHLQRTWSRGQIQRGRKSPSQAQGAGEGLPGAGAREACGGCGRAAKV